MAIPSPDAEPSSEPAKKPRKPPKSYKDRHGSTPEEQAAAVKAMQSLDEVDPEDKDQDLRGKNKLTRAKRVELMADVKKGIANGLHPKTVKDACAKLYSVSGKTVEKYLAIAKQELIKQTGYYPTQVREVVHKLLMTVAKGENFAIGDRLRAADKLGDIFDLKVTAEDNAAAEEQVVIDQMAKIDSMSVQQLSDYMEMWRSRGMTQEILFSPWEPPPESSKQKAKAARKKKP